MHIATLPLALAAVVLAACQGFAPNGTADFAVVPVPDKADLTSTGRNPYFILEPGYQLLLESPKKDRLTVSVLNETKVVGGVETRIVEERETGAGKLVEVSRNYFVVDRKNGDLFYFGEDVDLYKDGKVTGHEGSWLAGVNGAKAGLFIPGAPKKGRKFMQEQAPKVAMDRSEILSVAEKIETPAGKFDNCLKTEDGGAMEKDTEIKLYAPGVGLLVDEDFKLVKYGQNAATP